MNGRSWALLLLLGPLYGQTKEPVFFSWHAIEAAFIEKPNFDVSAQVHFRTRDHFSVFNLLRGSVTGSGRLPNGWIATTGYFRQSQEVIGADDWAPQHRLFSSISRPWRQSRFRHIPRFQYDYLFGMPSAAYGRYRFAWQTEWTGRVRPYAGVEEFVEHAGIQRFRPRAGVRFQPAAYFETDIVYIYDRIYLRGNTNRHILQTTFRFHRPGRD